MKKIYYYITAIAAIFIFTSNSVMGQAKCSTALPLTIGANDATCNSQTISTPTKLSNNTPPITTISGPACGLASGVYSNWFSFTGDGSTIRVKISGENHVIGITVFENQTCGATMTAKVCGTYPDDGIGHALDVATVNGANYLVAIVGNSSSLSGKVCAYKTNGLPYSSLCDATPVPITVKTKNVDCFAAGNYVNVSTNHTVPAPATPCAPATLDEWWVGSFTAIDTKTELYFWGKDETNASIEVLEGPCQAAMTSVFCNGNSGAKDQPNWGTMTTVIGKQYYVVIRTSSAMTAGRLCIYSQPTEPVKPFCTADMSFESGSGAAWHGTYGSYHLVSAPGSVFTWDNGNVGQPAGRFQLTSGPGVDPFISGMVPVVAPGGGSYSFRIGNNTGSSDPQPPTDGYAGTAPNTHASVEEMDYSFVVSSANAGFGYKYAVVIDYSLHPPEQQPLFDVVLTLPNSGNAVIPCGNYTHFANDGVSPFQFVGNNTDVAGKNHGPLFCPWTDVITDLSGYAGQTVNARFRVRDCEGGGNVTGPPYQADLGGGSHWCYAYFDTYCIPINITVPEYCAGTTSIQICGPPGYQTYTWPAGQPGVSGPLNGQCVTITNPSLYTGTTYTVNATSITGCPVTATVKLKNIPLTITTPASICPGVATNVSVAVDNPINPPYTFTWSNGLGTGPGPKTVSPAVTTTYTVTVSNGVGCSSTQAVIVNVAPCGINVTTTPTTICNGTCGTITATGSGGATPYTYSWSPGGGTGSSLSVCPTSTTTYTVIATDNAAKTASATAVVTVNPTPTVTSTGATICSGNSTTLTAAGATTYTWTPTTGLSSGTGTSVTANPTSTTTYTITGTIGTCTGSTSVVVTVNPKPTVTVPPATICSGNSTSLTATGSTTYTWSPSTGLSCTTCATVTANPTSTITYTVVGSFATGCTASGTVVVTVNPPCGPGVAATGITVCNGVCGTVTSTASSGVPPYTYLWNTGATTANMTPSPCPTATTTYTVTVTDNSVPVGTATAIAVITVNPNPVVTVPPATICSGTSTTLTASGATTYAWTPTTGLSSGTGTSVTANPTTTTTYTVTGSFATGCTGTTTVVVTVNPIPVVTVPNASICPGGSSPLTASGATTYTWTPTTGLSSGTGTTVTANPATTSTYTVIGTGVGGCTSSTTVVVNVGALVATISPNKTICFGASTQLTAGGGSTYSWTPATGLDNPNIFNPTASPTVTTTYTVVVSDVTCSDDAVVVITVNPAISLNIAGFPPKCAGGTDGQAVVIPSGGTSPYSYTWAPVTGTTASVSGAAGTYTVTVTDQVGCTAATSTVIVDPTPVTGTTSVITANCNKSDGSASATGSGGTGPYTYSWNTAPVQNTQTANNIPAGNYIVTITDANGCPTTVSAVVPNAPGVVASATSTNVSCNGGNDGTATANGVGGISPYTYSWLPTGGNAVTATTLTAGPYTVTITDSKGCTSTALTTITQPTAVVVTSSNANICPNATTTLTANGSGGTGAITYSWNPGALTGNTVTVAPSVTTPYTVTGTDANGCTGVTTITVTVQPVPVIVVPAATICEGTSTTLTASGTNTYSWSPSTGLSDPNVANPIANPTITTTYTIIGTSTFGCTNSTTVVVTVNPAPVVTAIGGNACPGDSITLTAGGAASYAWSPSTALNTTTGATVIAKPTNTTVYTITGIGANGCSAATTAVATVNPKPFADFSTSPNDANEFNPTIYFYDKSTGGTMTSWSWTLGDSLNTLSYMQNPTFKYPPLAHTYPVQLIVTNQYGCMDTVTGSVIIHGIFTFYIPNTFTPDDDGVNDKFSPKGVGIDETDYHLWIFDRWGNLIWQTAIWGEGWDGKANHGAEIAQIDTYVWKVHVKEKEAGTIHNYIGHVNIVK